MPAGYRFLRAHRKKKTKILQQMQRYKSAPRCLAAPQLPLAEVVTDYFDQLKSKSKGYASMEYKIIDYRVNDLVKLDIKINGEPADPLSVIVHR